MSEVQVDKWRKVKTALEKAGKTDSFFYRQALTVVTIGKDSGDTGSFPIFNK